MGSRQTPTTKKKQQQHLREVVEGGGESNKLPFVSTFSYYFTHVSEQAHIPHAPALVDNDTQMNCIN